jgi:hypothetical protein
MKICVQPMARQSRESSERYRRGRQHFFKGLERKTKSSFIRWGTLWELLSTPPALVLRDECDAEVSVRVRSCVQSPTYRTALAARSEVKQDR